MKDKQNFTIKELCELTSKIIEVEYSSKTAIRKLSAEERKFRYEKIRNLSKEDQIKEKEKQNNEKIFSQDEIEFMLNHQEFLMKNHYDKISTLLGIESSGEKIKADSIDDMISENELSIKKGKKPVEENNIRNASNFLSILNAFTDEKLFFDEKEITRSSEKLIGLCGSVENIQNFLGTHSVKDSKQPIHDLVISFELPNNQEWNREKWFELCMGEKKSLKLLSRANDIEKALGAVPKSYKDGMSVLRTIGYARAKEIELIRQSDLSSVMSKEQLYRYTELCIEHSISENAYNEGLDILMNPKLKNKDNLPDVVIDGSTIGKEFSKYYMTKIPIGDVRGLLLGKLTNCCQSIGDDGSKPAIYGMTNENGGFYIICEKGKSGKINIENDRIIAQSFTWLGIDGTKGKSLVFDSWERLGKDNDKLLDPFYSKFADIIHKQEVDKEKCKITKITIGTGGNTPKDGSVPFSTDSQPTQFNGTAPYNDAKFQYVILDVNHNELEHHILPYDNATKKKRSNILFESLISKNDIELLKSLLEKEDNNISDEKIKKAFKNALRKRDTKILELLLKNANIPNEDKYIELKIASEERNIEISKLFLRFLNEENTNISNEFFADRSILHEPEVLKFLLEKENVNILNETINKAFENAIEHYNTPVLMFLIKQCGESLTKKSIKDLFSVSWFKNSKYKEDNYKILVKHVPHSVIESVSLSFENEFDKKNFLNNVAKAEMEQSLRKADNTDSREAKSVDNSQKMSR